MEAIRSGVLAMGGIVARQLRRATDALVGDDDPARIDAVDTDEAAINGLQVSIDRECAQVIARRQPTAVDLRMVLAISKMVTDLERTGDEGKKIAYRSAQTRSSERLARMRHYDVARALDDAAAMLRAALDAFARLDAPAAAEIVARDAAVDAAFASILRQLVSYMMEDPRTISPALEIVFVAKSIERIGDHAKNIAEAVVQAVRGKDVRHASLDEIRAEAAGS
jgi:phosphate transport system protein